mgnify:CR=1
YITRSEIFKRGSTGRGSGFLCVFVFFGLFCRGYFSILLYEVKRVARAAFEKVEREKATKTKFNQRQENTTKRTTSILITWKA